MLKAVQVRRTVCAWGSVCVRESVWAWVLGYARNLSWGWNDAGATASVRAFSPSCPYGITFQEWSSVSCYSAGTENGLDTTLSQKCGNSSGRDALGTILLWSIRSGGVRTTSELRVAALACRSHRPFFTAKGPRLGPTQRAPNWPPRSGSSRSSWPISNRRDTASATRTVEGRRVVLVAGGGRVGTLYGTYDSLARAGR
jgi:hypothetical protein